jgi:hypothetical protein
MKDVVLLAVSVYLLRQDVVRVSLAAKHPSIDDVVMDLQRRPAGL